MADVDVESALVAKLASGRSITPEELLKELKQTGGVIDSLEGLELAIEAERLFQIRISDDELSSGICRSIPDLVACIRGKLASTERPKERQDDDRADRDGTQSF